MLKPPTEEAAVLWAKDQARTLPEAPSSLKMNLLVLLSIIKRYEEELYALKTTPRRSISDRHS